MHFFIFFPGDRPPSDEQLKEKRLLHLKDGTGPGYRQIDRGPSGHSGYLATWTPGGIPGPFDVSDKMVWDHNKARDYFVGWIPDNPPHPKELARDEQLQSLGVELGDANIWDIPVARMLPHENRFIQGKYCRTIAEKHRAFWHATQDLVPLIFHQLEIYEAAGGEGAFQIEFPMDQVWEFCLHALRINYRITPEVVDFLRLLRDDAIIVRLVVATCEIPVRLKMFAEEKKTELPTVISAPGSQCTALGEPARQ